MTSLNEGLIKGRSSFFGPSELSSNVMYFVSLLSHSKIPLIVKYSPSCVKRVLYFESAASTEKLRPLDSGSKFAELKCLVRHSV